MGFTPQQVGDMSIWQFAACVDGYNAAHGSDENVEPPTAAQYHDMVGRLH